MDCIAHSSPNMYYLLCTPSMTTQFSIQLGERIIPPLTYLETVTQAVSLRIHYLAYLTFDLLCLP